MYPAHAEIIFVNRPHAENNRDGLADLFRRPDWLESATRPARFGDQTGTWQTYPANGLLFFLAVPTQFFFYPLLDITRRPAAGTVFPRGRGISELKQVGEEAEAEAE